jgi:hypothetical protein
MTTEELLESWHRLRSARPVGEDQVAFAPVVFGGTDSPIELAVDTAGDLHLLVPTAGPATRALPPDFNGLKLRQGRMGHGDCLDLCSPAAHEAMFATLCSELISAILVEQREPWAAAVSIVRGWQSAWRPLRQPMSRSVQIGLAGELLMLQALWIPALGPEAVNLWSGPDRERHDFTSERLHMEVKATTRSRHEHEISRVDQLSAPPGRRLVLASVQLEESSAGSQSPATLIDSVLDEIRRDRAAIDGFLTRLDGLEWSDEMRRSPDLFRFHFRDAQLFEVDDEFPRLPPDFTLPPGLISIRYMISLANLPFLDTQGMIADIADNDIWSDR